MATLKGSSVLVRSSPEAVSTRTPRPIRARITQRGYLALTSGRRAGVCHGRSCRGMEPSHILNCLGVHFLRVQLHIRRALAAVDRDRATNTLPMPEHASEFDAQRR